MIFEWSYMKKLTIISLGILLTGSLSQATSLAPAESAKRVPVPVRWDLGDTLLKVDGTKCLKFLGRFNMPAYMASYLIAQGWAKSKKALCSWWYKQEDQQDRPSVKDHMKELFKNTLTKIASPCQAPDYEILGMDNLPLPALQRDYLLGKLSGENVMELVDAWIAKNPEQFAHKLQSSIFRAQMNMYFNHYEEVNKYNPKLFELFKMCHEAHDADGNRLFTNIICSNWPKGHVETLKAQFPELFKYSDMQLISGEMGVAKPHAAMYQTVPEEIPKGASNGFIVDDQQNNLTCATQYNVVGLDANNVEAVAHGLGLDIG